MPYCNPGKLDLACFPCLRKASVFSKKSVICTLHDLPFFLFSIRIAATIILLGLSVVLEFSWKKITAFSGSFISEKSSGWCENGFEICCKKDKEMVALLLLHFNVSLTNNLHRNIGIQSVLILMLVLCNDYNKPIYMRNTKRYNNNPLYQAMKFGEFSMFRKSFCLFFGAMWRERIILVS